jgi:hypothetical protein
LWTAAASLGPALAAGTPTKQTETVYRFTTPECEGRMSVEFLDKHSIKGFRFRDRLDNRHFCLSGQGEEGKDCLSHFSGSMAIALYHFRSLRDRAATLNLRERVRTIDQDIRLTARPPFERTLAVEREIVSDIQSFGYDPTEPAPGSEPLNPWCLLRQELYFDDQSAPFLIIHWKHTLNAITLIDVIPGDRTQLISG